MTAHDRRRLRALAIATLATLGGAVLCVLLTIAFPTFGMPQPYSGFLYIPPQGFLVALLAPTALILAFTTSISGLRQSHHAGQPGWTAAFGVALQLLLIGPTYFICAFGQGWLVTTSTIPTPQDPNGWWLLAEGSAAVLVVTAVCALVYASRARREAEPLQSRR